MTLQFSILTSSKLTSLKRSLNILTPIRNIHCIIEQKKTLKNDLRNI
jgi:hypothetical protein